MEKKKDINEIYEKLFDENNRNYFTYIKFLRDSGFSDLSEKTVDRIFKYFSNRNYFDGVDFLICCTYNSEEEGTILYAINTKDKATYEFIKDSTILITSMGEFYDGNNSKIYDAIELFNGFGLLESKYELVVQNKFVLDILFSKLKKEGKKILLLNEDMIEDCDFIDLPEIIEEEEEEGEVMEIFTNPHTYNGHDIERDLRNIINVNDDNSFRYEEFIRRLMNR